METGSEISQSCRDNKKCVRFLSSQYFEKALPSVPVLPRMSSGCIEDDLFNDMTGELAVNKYRDSLNHHPGCDSTNLLFKGEPVRSARYFAKAVGLAMPDRISKTPGS